MLFRDAASRSRSARRRGGRQRGSSGGRPALGRRCPCDFSEQPPQLGVLSPKRGQLLLHLAGTVTADRLSLRLGMGPLAPCLQLPDVFIGSLQETFEVGIVVLQLCALGLQLCALGLQQARMVVRSPGTANPVEKAALALGAAHRFVSDWWSSASHHALLFAL